MPDLTVDYQQTPTGLSATLKDAQGKQQGVIALDAPVALVPVHIAKPWGQEIWFSGIEARGESSIQQGTTTLSLSHYLALAPDRLTNHLQPLLLKILDPAPQASAGNLYFETHDSKQEVYVVTHVDTTAWPDAIGAIRLGMNQDLRKTFASDNEFRAAYLQAVKNYERVRRKIDAQQAPQEQATQPTTDDAANLAAEEQRLRTTMENFTASVPLREGDVVQVGTGIPHSLQHGVRVFEFQTPTYERNIISFNQKVLTQDHWDSSYAINRMSLDGPQPPKITTLSEVNGVRVERIVNFEDFLVQRITLAPGKSLPLPPLNGYAILALITGQATVNTAAGTLNLTRQTTAAFVPGSATSANSGSAQPCSADVTAGTQSTTLLLALPNPAATATIAADPNK